jgi:cellulose synthase/poly-beta-1,6-N-acetylglucosamine synthase-like glycosyltransferase
MIHVILVIYLTACVLLMLYGLNCHVMIHLFKRRLGQRRLEDKELLQEFYRDGGREHLPTVTSQIPIYNELNVVERIIDAVASFDYPQEKHQIQVLDDSTDETRKIVRQKINRLREKGIRIRHIIRRDRTGFKAGALRYGMKTAKGDLVAIFDADFVPPRDFLLNTVPFFVPDEHLGLVQTRWGHLNAGASLITSLQSIGINGHFMVEQSARSWNGLLMNFNGTAGVLRKQAILDAGNWQDDTLTEDMDLSYRMQLSGWRCRYLIDVVAPAEIPENINALKSQQFRWAKGSIQTAIKLLPRVWNSDFSGFCKVQATLHMTHYLVHPLMAFLSIMGPFLLVAKRIEFSTALFVVVISILILSFPGPSRLYWTAERHASQDWPKRVLLLPFLICIGCGLAINNTRAVIEAILGKRSAFIRTPKRGDRTKKHYRPLLSGVYVLEILTGVWCFLGILFCVSETQYLLRPFLCLYAIGFFYVGFLSFLHRKR